MMLGPMPLADTLPWLGSERCPAKGVRLGIGVGTSEPLELRCCPAGQAGTHMPRQQHVDGGPLVRGRGRESRASAQRTGRRSGAPDVGRDRKLTAALAHVTAAPCRKQMPVDLDMT
jgi:hypothetical protein